MTALMIIIIFDYNRDSRSFCVHKESRIVPQNEPLDQLTNSKRRKGAVHTGHHQNVLL